MVPGDIAAFVDYAQELEDAAVGTGLVWLRARRDEAVATINGGGSSSYITTTVDGQTFTRTIDLTAMDMFSLLQAAIRRFSGDSARMIYSDFDGIQH